ncbi:hypothetical protein [Paenibacillus alba]|uniref:DUF2536 family protein n=1 Tax=Paenibacillus alba TaxID=1197127 RepID=A0ABU6GAT8_9BACL|nr:hypothetical protein [Paenibacillus alba]MEC0231304.1 DUF2536 family protein [Paenibacillus alba]
MKVRFFQSEDLQLLEKEVNKAIDKVADDKVSVQFNSSVSEHQAADMKSIRTYSYSAAVLIKE